MPTSEWPSPDQVARARRVADRQWWAMRHLSARIHDAAFGTLPVHGPALPTASQGWTDYGFGFNRYCGPWVSTSGFRLTDGPNPARRIPNDVDLYRPHLYR